MKIVKPARLREFAATHRRAKVSLEEWFIKTKSSRWRNIADVRRTFPKADPVKVESGKTVTVFNIAGNEFRMVTAIHYDRGKVYVMRFMTHAEYNKDKWKETL